MSAAGRPLPAARARKHLRMRKIELLAIHCSATMAGRRFTAADLKAMHTRPKPRGNGWSDIGYHFVIELDGKVVAGRPLRNVGAHIGGHNADSIGICYVGGIGSNGKAEDTRTTEQISAMQRLLEDLRKDYPTAIIRGHRDMSPDKDGDGKVESHEWLKQCPCFDVVGWCRSVGIDPK